MAELGIGPGRICSVDKDIPLKNVTIFTFSKVKLLSINPLLLKLKVKHS